MARSHEAQFRLLFAEEAATRLERLGRDLLALERAPTAELIDSIFRDAHTLKGSAAMVGLPRVSAVAHAMEDLLTGVRDGTTAVSPAVVDALLRAVDGLGRVVAALQQGADAAADAEAEGVEAALHAAASGEAVAAPEVATTALAPPLQAAEAPHEPVLERETVRVGVDRLDALVRLVGEAAAANLRLSHALTERLGGEVAELSEVRVLTELLGQLQEQALRARMVPIATITDRLERAVRDVARASGKQVRWEVLGTETELDRNVLERLADPLLHLVRNAVDHGLEPPAERAAAGKGPEGVIRLHAMQLGSEVVIVVGDDGRGIDPERVAAKAAQAGLAVDAADPLGVLFRSGFSTAEAVTDVSGRGVGLDVVRSGLDAIRGRVEVRSTPGAGSEFRLRVPITLVVLPALIARAGGQEFALPMPDVLVTLDAPAEGLRSGGTDHVRLEDGVVPVQALASTLGMAGDDRGPVVVVRDAARRHAFRVQQLVGQRDVVVTGLGSLLPRLPVVAGASIQPDGSVLLVLDASGLIDRATSAAIQPVVAPDATEDAMAGARILVVDDALTVRELQRTILERAGHEVVLAGDGVEALARLAERPVDLVLTDLEMPRLDGLGLTEEIRRQPVLAGLPVVILTSRASEEDRRRGLDAGADAYVVKSSFDQVALLALVDRLLGRA